MLTPQPLHTLHFAMLQHIKKRIIIRAALLVIASLYGICVSPQASAQPRDTILVPLNRPEVISSKYNHWDNVEYRWALRGRGNIGQISGPQIMPDAVEIDARFVRTTLGIMGFPDTPKLPLNANGVLSEQYCATTMAMPGGLPTTQGACDIFFATNAAGSPRRLASIFPSTNAAQLRPFAFVPDNDTFSTDAVYTSTVRGANIPAQFLFVERLGEQSNTFYENNITSGVPTTFRVEIERITPELVVVDSRTRANGTRVERIMNDVNPAVVRRRDTIDFGNIAVGSSLKLLRILRNRGINPLVVELTPASYGTNPSFTVTSSSNRAMTTLERDTSAMQFEFTFRAMAVGEQTVEVSILTNDPTLTPNGTKYEYHFFLRGKGVNGRLSGPMTIQDLGNVRVNTTSFSLASTFVNLGSNITIERVIPPESPFGVARIPTLPAVLLPGGIIDAPTFSFTPRSKGDFVDEAIVRSDNAPDYRIELRGRGIQSSATITNTNAPGSNVIDFGITIPGGTLTRTITLQNTGNVNLVADGLFGRSPNGMPGDDQEFSVVIDPNVPLGENGQRTYTITFAPNPLFNRTGSREALLTVAAREFSLRRDSVTGQTFILRARVGAVLSVDAAANQDRERVQFDSVYLGRSLARSLTMRNLSANRITLLEPNAQTITPEPGSENAFALTDPLKRTMFDSNQTDQLQVTYTPRRRPMGVQRDSATFVVTYRSSDNRIETSSLGLSGVGVEQKMSLIRALPNPPFLATSVAIIGDTVDVGEVLLGTPKDVRITLRNDGNIPFSIAGQFPTALTPQNALDVLKIDSTFNKTTPQAHIQPNAESAMLVRFTPTEERTYLIRYTVRSDIRTRVATAPDSVTDRVFYIRGTGVQPAIDVAPTTLSFDSIFVNPGCANVKELTLQIRNPGTAPLNGALVLPLPTTMNSVFSLAAGTPTSFTIPKGGSQAVKLVFTAPTIVMNSIQSFAQILTITSNAPAPRNTLTVMLRATTVPAPQATLSVGKFVAPPGKQIAVPVVVNSAATTNPLTRISTAELNIAYNKTLLQYAGIDASGNAVAGSPMVRAADATTGTRLTIQGITQPSPSQRNLVVVLFDTFLGNQTMTEIAITNPKLGNEQCPEVVQITGIQNGTFSPDSVCNLPQKSLATTVTNRFALEDFSLDNFGLNAPTGGSIGAESSINFETAFETHVRLTLYDSRGERKETLVDAVLPAGIHTARIPAERLGAGVYFCQMQADIFHAVKKVVLIK